jgi:hypothetical protein
MSSRTGFGNISDKVNATTNTNIAINLPSHGTKRVFDIQCGYSLRTGIANTVLLGGRLLIIGQNFDSPTVFINPRDFDVSAAIGNAVVYFDIPIIDDGNNKAICRAFSWLNGLVLPDGQQAAIILTSCYGDGAAIPAALDVNAFLTVNGLVAGSDKIFKNV